MISIKRKILIPEYLLEFQGRLYICFDEIEFQKHEAWRNKTQLRATPTMLVNGYQLPENYKVEDLRYFTEFNVEIK